MSQFLRNILDWSEVWAPLIPLVCYLFNRHQPGYMKPVIAYFLIAFFVNLAGDIISDYKSWIPFKVTSNNPLYNVHSIIRFTCFSYFFILLKQPGYTRISTWMPVIYLLIIVVNFGFVENFGNPDHLSGNLLSAEAYLLLVSCMVYYLNKLKNEEDDIAGGPDFWVVTGLSIYVVVNFFVFLFYVPMIKFDSQLANRIWDVHNIGYIILCVFSTRAIYESARHQYAI